MRRRSAIALARSWLGRRRMVDGLAVGAGLLAAGAFSLSGSAAATRDAFIFMGFDTDRALLLVGGIGSVLAAAIAALLGARRRAWPWAGLLGLTLLFGSTFATETQRAFAAGGALGQFDVRGWILTFVTLVAAGGLIGLGIGIVASAARTATTGLWRETRAAVASRRPRDVPAGRLVTAAALVVALAISVPVSGQLLNYGPDSLMLAGGAARIAMVSQGNGAGSDAAGGAGHGDVSSIPGGTPGATPPPWLAWRPSGAGTVVERSLPAPWIGGTSSLAHFWVYEPPGYASSDHRYPVVYELPWAISLYDNGANVRPMLDSLMDSGVLPPELLVFLTSDGGPYPDNECIDSAGRRETFDTFVATTLVHDIDANFRTVPMAAARTLLGSSQGGFCAANLLLRHPDVFSAEISFSGYYLAAPLLHISPSAQAPYAGDVTLEQANSPMLEAGSVPLAERRSLELILIGNRQQPFYGAQLDEFSTLARGLDYQVAVLDTPYGHGWLAVRSLLPTALRLAALHAAAGGIFSRG